LDNKHKNESIALEQKHGVRYVSLLEREPNADCVNLLPADVERRFGMVPIEQDGIMIVVAMVDPHDQAALLELKSKLRNHVIERVVCSSGQYAEFMKRAEDNNSR
jgi:hypothetical protein